MSTSLKALAIIKRNNEVLAIKLSAQKDGKTYYRIVGGTIEFQEKSEDAVRREIREELNSELENLKLLTVHENFFNKQTLGRPEEPFHQIEFIYTADLANKNLYEQEQISVKEPGVTFIAEWIPIEKINNGEILMFPEITY